MANTNALQTDQEKFAAAPHDRVGPCLMNRKDAANYLQLSTDTLDRLCRDRKVAFYRIGRSIRFGRWDLLQFVTGKFVNSENILGHKDLVLTKAQLADFLCVSIRTIDNLIRSRSFWHRKTGGAVRFHLSDVLVQLNRQFRTPAVE